MGMKSESGDQDLSKRYKELCADLNLDKLSSDEAWQSFQRIGMNYTLEGDKLHWLGCAVYVACRKGYTPLVAGRGSFIEGNCVSLTRLLRSCKLSLVQFFNKMKKWSDMANLAHEMRNKIDHLERNFNVSTVIFKKFKPIFEDIFRDPNGSPPKQTKNRKQSRKQVVTPNDAFTSCWTLFVHVKANFPQISDDLVNSYHLLLACIDFCYSNALVTDNAKDLIRGDFGELPEDFNSDDFKPPESVPCIIQYLCKKWDGLFLDAKGIKEHWWRPFIKRMVDKRVFKCRSNQLLAFFDLNNYEYNYKNVMKEYDQYVLNYGDFDERVFLCENAHQELGTNQANDHDLIEKMRQHIEETRTLAPTTPLSNRQYLQHKEQAPITPVSNAMQTVSRLHSLLLGRKMEPSDAMLEIFKECPTDPTDLIIKRVREMGEKFLTAFTKPANDDPFQCPSPQQQADIFPENRLNLGIKLYYKTLEDILNGEKNRNPNGKVHNILMTQEMFHICLFACCMEIILYCYNSKRIFPWIIEVYTDFNDLNFQPFYFYRVIELIIRDEDGLSRDVVKHLNLIEEQILESYSWKNNSFLWEAIRNFGSVPSCQEVTLPSATSNELNPLLNSPATHFRRFNTDGSLQNPLSNSTASDRFCSPTNAKRRLFGGTSNLTNAATGLSSISSQQVVQISLQTQTATGEIRYIPAVAITLPQISTNTCANSEQKKVKSGPLALFFRKVYSLAALRLRDLCDRLNMTNENLRRRVWTCFEICLKEHTEIFRDRHLDQIIMCSIYSICKVTKHDQSFSEIMKCYRLQPQAASHVYRSVLLTSRVRRNSSSSDNSRNSTTSSPIPQSQDERERMRSSSTLPVPGVSSQPPTPTRVPGTAAQFDFAEERGDLIQFYNKIFVLEMKKFIMKFTSENGSPPLSPLPPLNANPNSPWRRVSQKHALYISPLKTANFPPSPNRPLSYSFMRSPAKDLMRINNMMRSTTGSNSEKKVSKRILQDDFSEPEYSPTKRVCSGTAVMQSKIQNIFTERQGVASASDNSSDDVPADNGINETNNI